MPYRLIKQQSQKRSREKRKSGGEISGGGRSRLCDPGTGAYLQLEPSLLRILIVVAISSGFQEPTGADDVLHGWAVTSRMWTKPLSHPSSLAHAPNDKLAKSLFSAAPK